MWATVAHATGRQAESLARGDSDGFVLEVEGPLLPANMRALVPLLAAQQVGTPPLSPPPKKSFAATPAILTS